MSIRNMFSSRGVLIFPLVALIVYWALMYYEGTDIEAPIPRITTFSILAVMIVLELAFRYKNGVSQKSLALRDLSSTLVNLWGTIPVMTALFTPMVLFLPELLFGRTLFFGSSEFLGPLWLQLILVIFFYSLLKYSIHRLQHRLRHQRSPCLSPGAVRRPGPARLASWRPNL